MSEMMVHQEHNSEENTKNQRKSIESDNEKTIVSVPKILTAASLASAIAVIEKSEMRDQIIKEHELEKRKITTIMKSIFKSIETIIIPMISISLAVLKVIKKK